MSRGLGDVYKRQPKELLLPKGGNGIFNVHNDVSACYTDEGKVGT